MNRLYDLLFGSQVRKHVLLWSVFFLASFISRAFLPESTPAEFSTITLAGAALIVALGIVLYPVWAKGWKWRARVPRVLTTFALPAATLLVWGAHTYFAATHADESLSATKIDLRIEMPWRTMTEIQGLEPTQHPKLCPDAEKLHSQVLHRAAAHRLNVTWNASKPVEFTIHQHNYRADVVIGASDVADGKCTPPIWIVTSDSVADLEDELIILLSTPNEKDGAP